MFSHHSFVEQLKAPFKNGCSTEDQLAILGAILACPAEFSKLNGIMKDEHFNDRLRATFLFIRNHFENYGAMPFIDLVRSVQPDVPDLTAANVDPDWLLDTVVEFVRHTTFELIILSRIDKIQNGKFGEIISKLAEASSIGINASSDPFATLWGDETYRVPPPAYLIRPWLVADTVTCVYGPPGSFESFMCLHAALCMATGTAFNGYP